MKLFNSINCALLLSSISLTNLNAQQTIRFKNGEQINTVTNNLSHASSEIVQGKFYRIIQFSKIPSNQDREALLKEGVELLDYLPPNAYYASIDYQSQVDLSRFNIVNVSVISNSYKLSEELLYNALDVWAISGKEVLINAQFFKGTSKELVKRNIESLGGKIIKINDSQIVRIQIRKSKLDLLYDLPYLFYFEQVEKPSEPENLVGVTDHRSNTIATAYDGGLKYDGTGVNVMMQDDGFIGPHPDYEGRIEHRGITSNNGDHGDHVAGIIMGAGNINPTARGMAFGSYLFVYDSGNDNYDSVPNLYNNQQVYITSKSYGNGVNAGYTSLARQLDQQSRQMPELVHVFSGGNSNGSGSTAAGSNWFNITGGHKSGKNVLAIANVNSNDVIANSSSRGPAEDGRIKPDISAVGTSVYSTVDPNTYDIKTGTSMACPGVAGTLAQLYQAYEDLNIGATPPNGLIKGIILNTADDLGNDGPDFTYGWGRINARRAYEVLSNNQYINSSVVDGASNTHSITVPSGVQQLKVMVYWTDYEGSTNASIALVNDINMVVTDPSLTQYNPWVLDPTPNATNLSQPAVRGVDNLNNMEQVTIDTPVAGTYTIDIDGFSIPQGTQEYHVVYEFINDEIVVTYPQGGEHLTPLSDEKVRWDAFGDNGQFTVEYSIDNGTTWTVASSTIPGNRRYYDWNIPNNITSGEALVRVSRNGVNATSLTNFSIIRVPIALDVISVCPDSMTVSWDEVIGATGYEVFLLGDYYMDSVGSTIGNSATTLTIPTPVTEDKWWSVRALGPNNCVGRRAFAAFQAGELLNCTLANDLATTNAVPGNGSYYNCQSSDLTIEITVENIGANPMSNFDVFYSIDGGTPVSSTINATLNSGEDTTYTFSPAVSLADGDHTLLTWCSVLNDEYLSNDTLSSNFILNSTVLTMPVSQSFELDANCSTSWDCDQTECDLLNGWTNEKNNLVDNIDWRVNSGPTPSRTGTTPDETGPEQAYNPDNASGNYVYTEASNDCNYQVAELVSPCIDLTTASEPELSFAYHMFDAQGGTMMGTLDVDVLSNGVWDEAVMTQLSGDQGDLWNVAFVDLSNYVGEIINIRFRGETGSGWRSDMALDEILIKEASAANVNELSKYFKIYPNPTEGELNYIISNLNDLSNSSIVITDLQGKVVISELIKNEGESIRGSLDLSSLPKGMYHIQLVSNDSSYTQKIVIW